ncbi:hypothetical protein ACLKA6_000142 [Drosophila palustris]
MRNGTDQDLIPGMPQRRPGSAAWSDPWTESGTDQNSIHEPDPGVSGPGPRRGSRNRKWNRPKFYSWIAPEHQVRSVGAILRPPPRARRPGCGSKSQAQSHPLPKPLGGRSLEREPELTKLAFQGGLTAVQTRPPGPIRGQKTEKTKILSTNRIQVFPGLVPGEDPEIENGTDRNSIPGSSPDHQVRPVGSTMHPSLGARIRFS